MLTGAKLKIIVRGVKIKVQRGEDLEEILESYENLTEEEKQQFMNYIEQQLAKIKIPNKDEDFLREKLLLMYSNPLVNYLAACR